MLHGTIDHGSDVHVALCNAHTLCKYRSSVHRPIACLLIAKELIYFKRRMSSGTFGDVRGGSFDAKARLKEGGDIRGGSRSLGSAFQLERSCTSRLWYATT